MRIVQTVHQTARIDEVAEVVDRYSPSQLALRVAIFASGVATLAAMMAADSSVPPVIIVLTAAFAMLAATHPDSAMGLIFVVAVAVEWAATVDDHRSPWSLIAALLLLVFHTATACSATGPPGARFPREVWRRWTIRLAGVALITTAAWVVTMAMTAGERSGHGVLLGAGLLSIAAIAWWLHANGVAPGSSPPGTSPGADRGDDGVEHVDDVVG